VYDCIVIGAGQAGLAASYFLGKRGARYLTLEANARVGDQWRQRWEGLQLFTPNRYNALPGSTFPGARYALPDRLAVADYLEAYVEQRSLSVQTDSGVEDVSLADDGSFVVTTLAGLSFSSHSVLVAAGAYRTPKRPSFAERLPKSIQQIHTADLRDPTTWLNPANQHVLVVGAGASGAQVAKLLAAKHRVTLAGRDPGHLPRTVLGRDIYDYLYKSHVIEARVNGLVGRLIAQRDGGGEIRVGESVDDMAQREGIVRVGRIASFDKTFQVEGGGTVSGIDAVVFATGYANAYPFLQNLRGALCAAGKPKHTCGKSPIRGLWWMGLHQMRRVNSSLLGGVARDAKEVVAEMVP